MNDRERVDPNSRQTQRFAFRTRRSSNARFNDEIPISAQKKHVEKKRKRKSGVRRKTRVRTSVEQLNEDVELSERVTKQRSNLRQIHFKPLDLKTLPKSPLIGIVAKRRSGKSVLTCDIIRRTQPDLPLVFVKTVDGYWAFRDEGIPKQYIKTEWNEEHLRKLIRYRDKQMKRWRKFVKKNNLDPETYPKPKDILLVIDDFAYDEDIMKSELIRDFFMNGRHYGFSIIITFQSVLSINSKLRGQVDIMCILREFNHNALKKLHEEYCSMIGTLSVFKKVIAQFCSNYGVMAIDLASQDPSPENMIYYYKATPKSENKNQKKIGHRKYREVAMRIKKAKKRMYAREKKERKERKKQETLRHLILQNHQQRQQVEGELVVTLHASDIRRTIPKLESPPPYNMI